MRIRCAYDGCGKYFTPRRKEQQFCSRKCRSAFLALAKRPNEIRCRTCHEPLREGSETPFCSDECKKIYFDRVRAGSRKDTRACLECGSVFIPTVGNQIYCSFECCAKARAEREKEKRAWAKIPTKKTNTWDEVEAYMREHDCQYTEAYRAVHAQMKQTIYTNTTKDENK